MSGGVSGGSPPIEVGPYTIVRTLGEGTLGTVYLAVRHGRMRRFAIRILSRDLWHDLTASSLMLDEAKTGTRLRHPNVVQIVDVGRMPNGVPYVVMEYAGGPSLDVIAAAARAAPDRIRFCCAILSSILSGLEHAHGVGIVHSGIAASDIRVTVDGVPKLLGLEASLLREAFEDTFSPRMAQQLPYTAPELMRIGGRPSAASDVFSLAACGWEGLAGRPLFQGASTVELVKSRSRGAVSLREVAPDVPEPVAAAIMAALDPEPLRRPSAAAFGAALRPFAAGAMQNDLADWLESLFPIGEDAELSMAGVRDVIASGISVDNRHTPLSRERVEPVGLGTTLVPAPRAEDLHPIFERSIVPSDPPAVAAPAAPARRRRPVIAVIGLFAAMLAAGAAAALRADGQENEAILLREARSALDDGEPRLALDLLSRLETRGSPEAASLRVEAERRLELERARLDLLQDRLELAASRVRRVLGDAPQDASALEILAQIEERRASDPDGR